MMTDCTLPAAAGGTTVLIAADNGVSQEDDGYSALLRALFQHY